jgi:hypothetical protein
MHAAREANVGGGVFTTDRAVANMHISVVVITISSISTEADRSTVIQFVRFSVVRSASPPSPLRFV